MSFVVGADSGLAFLSASSSTEAMQLLRNAGRYNGTPDAYKAIQIRDIGMSTSIRSELLLESYVNALVAFDVISSAIVKYIGPKGDKGDRGEPARIGDVFAEVDPNTGVPKVDIETFGDEFAKNILFKFKNLKGETGPMGPTGPPVAIVNNLETDTPRLALSASMGVLLKNMVDEIDRRLGAAVLVGSSVAEVDKPINYIKDSNNDDFYPVTHESAVRDSNGVTVGVKISQTNMVLDNQGQILTDIYDTVSALTSRESVVSWDGESAPDVSTIPAGVVVTYDETDYTGTLAPGSSTMDKTYLVGEEDSDNMNKYVTIKTGNTYYWKKYGSEELDLSGYQKVEDEVWLTEDEFAALEVKDPSKTYNVYEEVVEI